MLDNHHLKELSQAASIKLNLSQLAVEKDFYITQAIQVLTQVQNDYFELIFQGGTSLSKGYQLVSRLSEDVDFRVIQRAETLNLGKNVKRKKLSEFRHDLVNALKITGFILSDNAVQVFYEGRFMRINAAFAGADKLTYLKPHVAIECFMGDLVLPPISKPITTLIKVALGEKCNHTDILVNCAALDETTAEKWVALTRRISNSQIKARPSDKHLVRHLYDLYHLTQSGLLTGDYQNLIAGLLKKDSEQFQKYNLAYNENPIQVSQEALAYLLEEEQWKIHWEDFLMQMVYSDEKPSFEDAYNNLAHMSEIIFSTLDEHRQNL